MEEPNYFVLRKGLFALVKGHLFLIKWYSNNPEGQVEVKSPLVRSYF